MPPRPIFTTRLLMIVVALVAVDFVIVLNLSRYPGIGDIGTAFVTLPMANLLALVAPRAWSGIRRRFWVGFQVAGWLMVLAFGYLSSFHGATFFQPVNSIYPWWNIKNYYISHTYIWSVDFLFYTPPQVLAAWLAGRMAARRPRTGSLLGSGAINVRG